MSLAVKASVHVSYDGALVPGDLLAPPNAIGICRVRLGTGEEVQRVARNVRAASPAAEAMLASGDSFARRDVDPVELLARAAVNPETPRPKDWQVSDLELLKIYASALYAERSLRVSTTPRGPKRNKAIAERDKAAARLSVVSLWLKHSRMQRTVVEAGITEDQARDPMELLRLACGELARANKQIHELGGEDRAERWRLVAVIDNYLNHFAKPTAAPIR